MSCQVINLTKVAQPIQQDSLIFQTPNDIFLEIFQWLSPKDIVTCSEVCRKFYHLTNSPSLWKLLFRHTFPQGNLPATADPRAFFRDTYCLYQNAPMGLYSQQKIMDSPDNVEWHTLAQKGTVAIGHREKVTYICDMSNTVQIQFISDYPIYDAVEVSPGKIALLYRLLNDSVCFKIFDLDTKKIIAEKHGKALTPLKNGKIAYFIERDKGLNLEIYDARSGSTTTLIEEQPLCRVYESLEGKIITIHDEQTLTVWDLNTKKAIHPTLKLSEVAPGSNFMGAREFKDGRLMLSFFNLSNHFVYDPRTNSTQPITNFDEFMRLLDSKSQIDHCSGETLFMRSTDALRVLQGDQAFSFPLPSVSKDFVLSSPKELTLLCSQGIYKLDFGKPHNRLLSQMEKEFSKAARFHLILEKMEESLNSLIDDKNCVSPQSLIDLAKSLSTQSLIDLAAIQKLISLLQKDADVNSELSLVQASMNIKIMDDGALQFDIQLKQSNGQRNYSSRIVLNKGKHLEHAEFFKKIAGFGQGKEVFNLQIDLDLMKRFNLLPDKLRKEICGELIEETSQNPYDLDLKERDTEHSKMILAYLNKKGYKVEEMQLPPVTTVIINETKKSKKGCAIA